MLVCDFCAVPSQQDLNGCRCFHSFCDGCANVGCCEDENFTACSFCPKCAIECEVRNYESALQLARMLEEEEQSRAEAAVPQLSQPPLEFVCPITLDIMEDPVVLADGFTYERTAIEDWMDVNTNSPMTGARVSKTMIPNTILRVMINEWKERNGL